MAHLIYILDENAGKNFFIIKGDLHKYLVKVLRHKEGDILTFRNRENIKTLYKYKIETLNARNLNVKMLNATELEIVPQKELHIAWCVIDIKSIEKVLPSLNEIGVSKISFIYCDRSQKNFKLDFKRFERILESSMQQSGRTHLMKFGTYKNVTAFITDFPNTKVFDFSENILKDENDFKEVLIGCEGGFSKNEKKFLQTQEIFRLNTPMVLRSESAVMAVSSKILL